MVFRVRFHLVLAAGIAVSTLGTMPVTARPRQTQSDLNQAAAKEYKAADAALNRAYQKLYNYIDADEKAKLKTAHQAWLKFRDVEAEFRASKSRGGSVQPMLRATYLTQLTIRRTKELNDAYKQFATEGEL